MSVSLRAAAPAVRLGCEALEDRATPAAVYALSGAALVAFDTTATTATTTTAITGVGATETLVGIDFRPSDGHLYALGVNAATDKATLYTVALDTGAATAVGTAGAIAFVDSAGKAVNLPAASVGYGMSFDPAADQLRVVTGSGLNFRIDPATGAPVDGNTGLAGSVTGTNPDGAINGLPAGSTGVGGTAYTNAGTPGGATTQYTLDAGSDALYVQGAGSTGTQSGKVGVTLNGAPLNFTAVNGFAIPAAVAVAKAGDPATGAAVAALTVGGATHVYQIDLTTGTATDLGAAPAGTKSLVFSNVAPKTVEFAGATFDATEAGQNAAINLTRSGDLSAPLTVSVVVSGGTATAGVDFTGTSHVVTFAAGESTAVLNIPLIDDHTAEPDKTLVLTLSAPSVGTVGAVASATVAVADSGAPAPTPAPGDGGTGNPTPTPTPATGPSTVVVGSGIGSGTVAVLNADGTVRSEFNPYGEGMLLGVKVATGDVNGDGVKDIVTAPGVVSSHVKVFDGATGQELRSFLAFDPLFLGGVTIATGDVNGDGKADVIVGAALGSSHVKVYDGATGAEIVSFLTLPGSTSGVTVAAGDINGDGRVDLVTGASTGLSRVRAFDLTTGAVLQDFVAYRGFAGGVTVATADVNGDGAADIITGTAVGSSHVKVFDGKTQVLRQSYLAFAPGYAGGVNVGSADVNGDGVTDILVSGAAGTDHTKFYSGTNGGLMNSFFAFGPEFTGGVFID